MAPPHTYRRVARDNEDQTDFNSLDAEALQQARLLEIQSASLGNQNYDDSVYGPVRAPVIPVRRQCDEEGTLEAHIASKNKEKTSGWTSFHLNDDKHDLPISSVFDPNGHRNSTRALLHEEAKSRGFDSSSQLSLEDTYGHSGKRVASFPAKRPAALQHTFSSKRTDVKKVDLLKQATLQGKGRSPGQYPTRAASRTGSKTMLTNDSHTNAFSELASTKKVSRRSTPGTQGAAQTGSATERPTPAGEQQLFSLAQPSDFIALRAKSGNSLQRPARGSEQGAPVVVHPVQDVLGAPVTEAVPDTALQTAVKEHPNLPIRLRRPLGGLPSAANATSPSKETSTHSDGVHSPASLSGLSAATQSHANDLIGLGIENLDVDMADGRVAQNTDVSSSQKATSSLGEDIMDSPILDDVKSEVLSVSGPFIFENGRAYVDAQELLALKRAIEKQLQAIAPGMLQTASPAAEPPAASTAQQSLGSSKASQTVGTNAIPIQSVHANPFAVREPLQANDANIATSSAALFTAPTAQATESKGIPKDAVTPIAAPRRKLFTSKETIQSKWASEPADIKPVSSVHQPVTSRNTFQSIWGTDEPCQSTPPRNPTPPPRNPTPIIGDGRMFGAMGPTYAGPPSRAPTMVPTKPRRYDATGPGFAALLERITNMPGHEKAEDEVSL